MRVINWLVIIVLFIFWLAEDEVLHIEESVQEGEFDMDVRAVSHEQLSESSYAIVYADGGVTINDESMGLVALGAAEAYALLDVLYRHEHILRGRQDTVPLKEEPAWYDKYQVRANADGLLHLVAEAEQWQATGTCQLDEKHTGRDVFRCDGCERMACNQCGELMEDVWLCEACLMPKEPIMAHPF